MSTSPIELQADLERLATEHKVVGATAAVWDGQKIHEAAAGVLNIATGVEVTTDSIFQIGSISKVYTATLVMQLVDEARLELDTPIISILPEFKVADAAATTKITMRHLLTHTSGIDGGDYIDDFGTGDDACAKYVDSLATIGQIYEPGRYVSYTNAGFVVAGRVIEVLTKKTWHQALADNLFGPGGLSDSVSLPEEALLRRAAVGHRTDKEGMPVAVKQWRLPHAIAAAGSCICTTAADLVRFGLIHVRGGKAQDGTRVISEASVKAMQDSEFTGEATFPGLAWGVGDRNGHRIISHGGGTLGQTSLLMAAPDDNLVVGVSTNSPSGGALIGAIAKLVFERLEIAAGGPDNNGATDVNIRTDVDLDKFTGLYRRTGMDIDISRDGDQLVFVTRLNGYLDGLVPVSPPAKLVAVDDLKLAPLNAEGKPGAGAIEFLEPGSDGRPLYMRAGRIARRVPA